MHVSVKDKEKPLSGCEKAGLSGIMRLPLLSRLSTGDKDW